MKHLNVTFGIIICMLFEGSLSAQPQQKLKIDEAVVFLNEAQLTSSARIKLVKGESEILFTNVARDINNQSVNVTGSGGVVVESVTFQNDYLSAEILTPRARDLRDSINTLRDAKKLMDDKMTVIRQQIELLVNNKKVAGDNTGLSVSELTKLLDLYSSRYETLLNQQGRQEQLLRKTDERIAKLSRQLAEEQESDQTGGQLLVKFYAADPVSTNVSVAYVVPDAGWSPTYDIISDAFNQPVKVLAKANIHQSCGLNWEKVKLLLSSGNPNDGVNAPTMTPWYLAFMTPEQLQTAIGENGLAYAWSEKADTTVLIDPVDGKEQHIIAKHDQTKVDNGGVNTTFDIDLPYSIPSDGKEHLVPVKKYELPATYRYYAVPKLDNDAFLQAQVTNWEELNLLPGTTNIFYEGTYVGQGTIDVRNVKDTFTISLGRDKKVIVKRERDTKFRSVHTIGANVRETFGYSITVRNTRKENISLTIQDQMPVSNDKDIVLEDLDYGGATAEENTGLMNWNLQIAHNETRKLGFGFTVKYLKGKTIGNLR